MGSFLSSWIYCLKPQLYSPTLKEATAEQYAFSLPVTNLEWHSLSNSGHARATGKMIFTTIFLWFFGKCREKKKKNWLLGNMLYSRILKDFPATHLLIFTFKKDSWWVNNKLLLIIGSIGHMKTSEIYLTSRDFLLSSCLHFSLYSVWG